MLTPKNAILRSATALVVAPLLLAALAGCSSEQAPPAEASGTPGPVSTSAPATAEEPETEDADGSSAQASTCDWEAPMLSAPADPPAGQAGDLPTILVGAWQHTHTDEGSGFEPVTNDHRYVFSSPEHMLYCQHVPGATEYAENAADIVLNGTTIELPGGTYSYTVMAWDENTLVWDNPVGGGYVYLLERR